MYRILFGDNGGLHAVEHHIIQHANLWQKPRPAILEDLSSHGCDTEWSKRPFSITGLRTIERISDAYLVWSDKFFVKGEAKQSQIFDQIGTLGAIADTPQNSLIYSASGIRRDSEGLYIDLQSLPPLEVIEDRVMFGSSDEPDNWGLFLTTTLPAAAHFVANRDRFDKFMCFIAHPNMARLIELVGVDTHRDLISHSPLRPYFLKDVTYFRRQFRDLVIPPKDQDLYQKLGRSVEPSPYEKIFVARGATSGGNGRPLLDEEALSSALEDRGFRTVYPHQHNADEQIALFYGARSIVTLGGAGAFNAVFCKPGTKLLDIESTGIFLEAHTNMFASLHLNYGAVIGNELRDFDASGHKPWTLDLAQALPIIDSFFD